MLVNEYAEQFSHIREYVQEIMFTNSGPTVIVETVPNAAGEDVFKRFYVCYKIIRSSWKGTCRPVIGLWYNSQGNC